MKPDPTADTAVFTFRLTPRQAQEIYGLFECMREEPAFREIWNTKQKRAFARTSCARFSRQLNNQYKATGIEVWPS